MTLFFEDLSKYNEKTAVVEGNRTVSYSQLVALLKTKKDQITSALLARPLLLNEPNDTFQRQATTVSPDGLIAKKVICIVSQNSLNTLVNYLALLQLRLPIIFISQRQFNDLIRSGNLPIKTATARSVDVSTLADEHILKAFRVPILLNDNELINMTGASSSSSEQAIDANAALLLSTSGSTGESKHVLLSYTNIQANVDSICAYLPMQMTDVTITTLPFNYSYGLSVINTHLAIGACIVMTQYSIMQREFWTLFEHARVSNFAGVPHSYDMLLKLKFIEKELPHLRYFTQAGGKLAPEKIHLLASYASAKSKAFIAMYGQTEATARMSYAFENKLLDKPNTIGRAIPGTRLALIDESGKQILAAGKQGEIIFYGNNVMLGYAQSIADLSGRSPADSLKTGDIGYRDADGDFFISGRKKRFIKLFGERISLDKVQAMLQQAIPNFNLACVGNDETLFVMLDEKTLNASECDPSLRSQKQSTAEWMADEKKSVIPKVKVYAKKIGLPARAVKVYFICAMPITANAKIDYKRLLMLAQDNKR